MLFIFEKLKKLFSVGAKVENKNNKKMVKDSSKMGMATNKLEEI